MSSKYRSQVWQCSKLYIYKFLSVDAIVWVKTNDNNNCPFYNHFWPFFCQLYVCFSQNWGSDSHFGILNRSKIWLVQKLWHKMQIFPFLVFSNFVQKHSFAFFAFFLFCMITIVPIKIWTPYAPHNDRLNLIFVKVNNTVGKKWPDMVLKCSFISCYILKVSQAPPRPPFTSEAKFFEPINI